MCDKVYTVLVEYRVPRKSQKHKMLSRGSDTVTFIIQVLVCEVRGESITLVGAFIYTKSKFSQSLCTLGHAGLLNSRRHCVGTFAKLVHALVPAAAV